MKVQKKSKKKPPKFELNPLRSKDGLKILRLLAEGKYQSEIAKRCILSKTKVNYWTAKFLKIELIRVKTPGKPIFYELTSFGTKILTRSESERVSPMIMEDYAVKFRLVRDNGSFDWEKLGEPKNWIKLGIKLGSCRVEKTSKSIIIHSGRLQGFSFSSLLVEAGQIIGLVKDFLEQRGVDMDSTGIPVHEPIFRFYTPEAEVLSKRGTFYTANGAIDCSDGVPHVEWKLETARNYLEMPNRVKRIEENLEKVSDSLVVFAEGMREHMKLIESLQVAAEALTKLHNKRDNEPE